MHFKEVLELLRDGKKVTLPWWDGLYIKADPQSLSRPILIIYLHSKNFQIQWYPTLDNIGFDPWKVLE